MLTAFVPVLSESSALGAEALRDRPVEPPHLLHMLSHISDFSQRCGTAAIAHDGALVVVSLAACS